MTLFVHLLGQAQISRNGDPIDIPGHRPLALLAYLLVTGEAHSRKHLVDLLFEGPDDPRAALRWTLFKLRKAIGPEYLLADRQEIAFNLESDYWLDVAAFEAGQLDLYRGDFLEGLGVRDAHRFEDWLFFERERLRASYQAALTQQLVECESHGDYAAVVETAHHLLRLDNLREDWYRALMRAYARQGKREVALAQYDQCCRVLAEELGIEPAQETISLYEQIQAETLAVVTSAPVRLPEASPRLPAFLAEATAPVVSEHTLFVARERELARLAEHLNAALEGQGRVVFVTGEAGRGKTALLRAFARRAQVAHAGLIVARGNCNAYSGAGDPYLPFRDVLGMLSGDVESRWAAGTITQEHARRLWALMPYTLQALVDDGPDLIDVLVPGSGLVTRIAASAPGMASWQKRLKELTQRAKAERSNLQQRQLFEQYTQVLHTLAARRPLLVLLDDLQWADTTSINLLFHMGRRLTGGRILIVGAYRASEVASGRPSIATETPQPHPLKPVVNEFKRHFGDIEIDLGQIPPAESRAFVDTLLDSEPNRLDEAFRAALFRQTEGHPLFTIELLRHMQERGDLVQDDEGCWIEVPPLDWDALPARAEAVIEQRLGRLDAALRDILSVASVQGETFTAQIVARLQDLSERQLLHRLSQELQQRHRLVQDQGEMRVGNKRLSRYQFGHVLVQQYLYDRLSPGERRLLHGETAALLEELYQDHTDEITVPLARHYAEAGQGEKAIPYLSRAGDHARLAYAHEEAIDFYQRALTFLKEQADYESAARTLMQLGLTHHNAFNFEQARQAYEEGFALWQQAGQTHPDAPRLLAAHTLRRDQFPPPVTLDPTTTSDIFSIAVIRQLFSGLLGQTAELEIVPDVAWRWEVLESGRKYVFHLRDDVRWTDGTPVTAEDFVYAWKRMLDPATRFSNANKMYDIKGARAFHQGKILDSDKVGVQALDEVTLAVELESPTSYFLHLLAQMYPVPRHMLEIQGEAWADANNIVTNGPFKLEAWQPEESLVLIRNPAYHGQFTGNVKRMELCLLPEWSDRLEMYENDKLDVLSFYRLPPSEKGRMRQQYAGEYVLAPELATYYIAFDTSRPPFNDLQVRRAFVLATDKEMLANVAWRGGATPATGGLVPPGVPGYSAGIGLPYNLDQARQLLAAAGYLDGDGFPTVEALVPHPLVPQSEYLQANWRENLGIEIHWHAIELNEFLQRLQLAPPNMSFAGWGAGYPDPDYFLRVITLGRLTRWQNETYERLVKEARRITDQKRRMEMYRQADKILVEEAPLLLLVYPREALLVKPWVKKYPTSPFGIEIWFGKDVIIEPH